MGEPIAERSGVHREYDWDEVDPTVAILESISVFEHGDVSEAVSVLDKPLATYIETDALDALIRGENTTSVAFRIADYHVQIYRNIVEVAHAEF